MIGEAYRNDYVKFVKEKVQNPSNGMLRKSYHTNADLADKFDSAYATAFTAMMLKPWEPEWTEEMYTTVRDDFMGNYDFDMGAYVIESLPESAKGKLENMDVTDPGMIGEGPLALLLMQAASREFDDAETFNSINKTITNIMRPKWTETEIRSVDNEETGIPGFTMGNVYNMFQGWTLLSKVHVGWETIIDYDWSKNKDSQGQLMDYGGSKQTPP